MQIGLTKSAKPGMLLTGACSPDQIAQNRAGDGSDVDVTVDLDERQSLQEPQLTISRGFQAEVAPAGVLGVDTGYTQYKSAAA
jgi:hypothetical protein